MRMEVELRSTQAPSAEAMAQARQALERAVASLWRPASGLSVWRTFYACLAAQLEIDVEWDPLVRVRLPDGRVFETGRGGWTDGRRIVINAAMLGDEGETLRFLIHELEHVARMHTLRMGERDPWLWNIATDLVIDAQIAWEFRRAGAAKLSVPIGVSETDAEEDVYRELVHLRFDPSGYGADLAPLAAAEAVRQRLEQAVRVAALRSEEIAPGSVPDYVLRVLHLGGKKVPEWVRIVQRWMEDMSGERRTWSRLHRRSACLSYVAPGRKRRLEKMGLVIDTSGSMRYRSVEDVLGEVRAMAQEVKVGLIVWQVDAAVHGPIVYERPEDVPPIMMTIGGGGTVMQPAAEAVAKVRPPLTLWVTDGWWLDAPNLPEGRHVAILTGLKCIRPRGVRFDDVVWTDDYRQQIMTRWPRPKLVAGGDEGK